MASSLSNQSSHRLYSPPSSSTAPWEDEETDAKESSKATLVEGKWKVEAQWWTVATFLTTSRRPRKAISATTTRPTNRGIRFGHRFRGVDGCCVPIRCLLLEQGGGEREQRGEGVCFRSIDRSIYSNVLGLALWPVPLGTSNGYRFSKFTYIDG